MKTTDKSRQNISYSQSKTANAKFLTKRMKININSLENYLEYMYMDEEFDNNENQ